MDLACKGAFVLFQKECPSVQCFVCPAQDNLIREEAGTVGNLHDDDSTGQEEQEDHEGDADEREIWQVTDVTEEDFETTEGESVDLYDKLMEMVVPVDRHRQ